MTVRIDEKGVNTKPLEYASNYLGSSFEIQIIQVLLQSPQSFEELLVRCGSPRKKLAHSLYTLEERGVVEKSVDSLYGLTRLGYSLQPIFHSIDRCIGHPS